MKGCRLCLIIVISLLHIVGIAAQRRYQYICLKHIATSLQLSSELDTLRNGTFTYTYRGKPIKVCIDGGRINHIGYALFPLSTNHQSFSAIYNFVERYLLDLHLNIGKENNIISRMEQDGVSFYQGNFDLLLSFVGKKKLNVLLEELDGKVCKMTLRSEQNTCVLVFPIEYDLLHSTNMLESEKNIVEDLKATIDRSLHIDYPDTSALFTQSDGLLTLKGETIYTKQLSSNQYFTLSEGVLHPVYDKVYLEESLANLFCGLIPNNRYKMRVFLIKYNYKSEYLHITLNQWIRYCQDSNCQSYFGLIDVIDEVAECEWIMKNDKEGYCHVMRVYVPLKQWEDKTDEIRVRLNSYIPISKIKSLYDELSK